MARTVRDAKLDSRAARLRLGIRSEPYWRTLEKGFALGYRRRANGGTWLARRWSATGTYLEHKLATTDDLQDADGVSVLDFSQAQQLAREWWRLEQRREEGHDARTDPFTVTDAVADYLKVLQRRGGKSVYHARRVAETHIVPALGPLQAAKLTAKRIENWHHDLAEKPALARSKPGKKPNFRKVDNSVDGVRKRRATANRILTVLKASLNHAWKSGHVPIDDAWRRVRPFRAVDTARIRYLKEDECVRIVNACEPAFRNLVHGALLTGCRYSELTAMRVADFNSDAGTVTVRNSKAGKPRHVVLTEEGQELFAVLTAGKESEALIFTRADGGMWRASHQLRPMTEACMHARIKPIISFNILRHTHGSMLAMKHVPMGVIAQQLGHADTRMTEKHYAHLSGGYVADTIRAHFPKLRIDADHKVASLTHKKQS